ncbi:esterase/lipase family protein [Nocardioides caeni]|uniref:Alpha/beta hydrolase n=1 Tax=Nocardioides caeni TaxID=574700 RepID=A0A4S8NLP9_9ACTN|nr:alpha/beta hydrolase [Nocardioides caeni]THV17913.1 alpha/beta hydrolase [Nocardioides caeni]
MRQDPTIIEAIALATAVVDELVVATARDTHHAVTDRVHGLLRRGLGPAGTPAELLHRGISGTVYGAVGLGLRGASRGLARVADSGHGPGLEEGPRGRFVSSAINGLIGEELRRERPRLAIEMGVRRHGHDVRLTRPDVAAAFPRATGQLVVFLHGLCETEDYWRRHRDRTGATYGETLAGHGWTPVYLRANTGLPLRENGVVLASLLQRLVDVWPTDVTRIALVGHSLGGLVIRASSAVIADGEAPAAWTRLVSDVVTLGTPHLGSWFAVSADRASRRMSRIPEVAPFGRIIDRQAPGIHDLIEGLAHDVPPLPHARYRLVSASLSGSPRHPVARSLGDLLVTPLSAVGRDRQGTDLFPDASTLHVGRADHFDLLNHPEIHRALVEWLVEPAREVPAPVPASAG